MNRVEYNIYQSLPIPVRADADEVKTQYLRGVGDLSNLEGLEFPLSDTTKSSLTVKRLFRLPNDIHKFWKWNKVYMRQEVYFRFTIKIVFEEQYYEQIEKEYPNSSNQVFVSDVLPHEVEKRFYDLMMVLNLCNIGGFHF